MSMISEIRSAKGREAEVRDQWLEVSEQAAQNRKSKISCRSSHRRRGQALRIRNGRSIDFSGNIRGFHRERRFERAGVTRQLENSIS